MIKVKILKSLTGTYENYEIGKVYSLTPNQAHTFIELGYAEVFKGFDAPPKDKMIRRTKDKKKLITK